MAFDFRLEKVMNFAINEKESLEAKYQQIYQNLENQAHLLMDLMAQKQAAQADMQQRISRAMTIDSLKSCIFDVNNCEKMIVQKKIEYERIKVRLEQMKPILLEKTISVKKYEKIREKEQKSYKKMQIKKDMKQMDEIASLRVIKNG